MYRQEGTAMFLSLRRRRFPISFAILFFAASAGLAHAQNPTEPAVPNPSMPSSPPHFGDLGSDKDSGTMAEKMLRERNEDRQKAIVNESNQLLDLAKELKDAVDKSSKDQLSLAVVRKAEEIEKLAKDVKTKMRDGTIDPTSSPWNTANTSSH
jgi:hypothetical protein